MRRASRGGGGLLLMSERSERYLRSKVPAKASATSSGREQMHPSSDMTLGGHDPGADGEIDHAVRVLARATVWSMSRRSVSIVAGAASVTLDWRHLRAAADG